MQKGSRDMFEMSEEGCAGRLQACLPGLHGAEKSVAAYILQHMTGCMEISIHELAHRCGCSSATVIRLCKKIGYSGYADLKYHIRKSLESHGEGRETFDGGDSVFAKCRSIELIRNRILETVTLQDEEAVDCASGILTEARRIVICSSTSIAMVVADYLLSFGMDASAVSNDVQLLRAISHLEAGDVVIGLNYEGYSKTVVDALMLARKKGIVTIVITSFSDSLCAKYADILLYTPDFSKEAGMHFTTVCICQMIVLEMLMTGIWRHKGDSMKKSYREDRYFTKVKKYKKIQGERKQ